MIFKISTLKLLDADCITEVQLILFPKVTRIVLGTEQNLSISTAILEISKHNFIPYFILVDKITITTFHNQNIYTLKQKQIKH